MNLVYINGIQLAVFLVTKVFEWGPDIVIITYKLFITSAGPYTPLGVS